MAGNLEIFQYIFKGLQTETMLQVITRKDHITRCRR